MYLSDKLYRQNLFFVLIDEKKEVFPRLAVG